MHELRRRKGKYGMTTACIGGGPGDRGDRGEFAAVKEGSCQGTSLLVPKTFHFKGLQPLHIIEAGIVQGLKPTNIAASTARLRSCPDTKQQM